MSKQGEFIKNARRKMGLTQKQVADKLNVSDKVVSKWEVGDSFPDHILLPRLAELLQVDVQEILNGEYLEKPSAVAETKEVVYVERKTTEKPRMFKDKIIYALKFMYKYRSIFFASFLGLSLILLFCRFFSWEVPQMGFKNSFFKLLFAPFQKDINKFLYGDYVSAMNSQFTTNTNILVYIISALIWLYIIFIAINIFMLIKSAVKKVDIERKIIFKSTMIYSILTIVLFILSFVLKSQFIKMFNSSGLSFDNYESMGLGAKTCNVLPLIWSFIVTAFSSVFNFAKAIFEENVEGVSAGSANSFFTNQNASSAPRISKENVPLTPEKKEKRKKIKKIAIIIVAIICFLSAGIGGFFIYNNFKPSPQNTIKAYLNNLNSSSYDNNFDLLYATTDDDKLVYDTLTYSYRLYNNLSLFALNTIYEESGFGIYNATITGNYIVSGNSTLTTYKIDIPMYHHNGKYLLLEPLDFTSGTSCVVDKTNKCVVKNNELVLYYGNNFNNFRIPEGVTTVKSTFYTNIETSSEYRILYNVNSSNPNTYTRNSGRIRLTAPTRTGYEFYGWIGTGISSPQSTVIIDAGSTGNRYYIALWNATHYSINYEDVETNSNPRYYTIEDEVSLSYPEKRGYVFRGWTGTGLTRETANVTMPKGSYGDKTYTAHWNAANYVITYNLNGGQLSSSNPTIYTIESDSITLNNPTKNGYTFIGWTGSNGTTPKTSISISKGSYGDKTYTANWTKSEYTITYKLNGGTTSGTNPTSYNIETNSFTLINPTRNYYTFAGWTCANNTIPQKKYTINKGSYGDLTMVASWTPIDYSITYNLNGGKNNSSNRTTYNIETPTFSLYAPTKTGYTFAGWTSSNDSTMQTSLSIKKGSTGNKSYTANWTAISYSIAYNLNGGTNSFSNPSSYTIESDTITLKSPTREGYIFAGWTGSNGSTKEFNPIIKLGSIGHKSFTANWTAISYSITYNLNGGKNNSSNPASYTIESENISLKTPAKNGYTFMGWTGSNGSTPQKNITISKGSYGNKSYVANWIPQDYIILYNLDGGTNSESNPTCYNIESENFTLSNPTKNGYTFIGWTGSNGDEKQFNVLVQSSWLKNLSYTANWQVNEYIVTYNANGGNVDISSQNICYDEKITHPKPTKTGYTFDGWYYDKTLYADGIWKTSSNIELTAKWTTEIYQIVYKDITPSVTIITLNYNYSGSTNRLIKLENNEIFEYPNIPERDGHIFTGWYLDSSCTNLYNFNEEISQSIMLYAGWDNYTIVNDSTYSWSKSNGIITSTNKKDSSSSTYKIIAPSPITISFGYKTSSESNCDFLYIKKNGTQLVKASGIQSNYTQYSVDLDKDDYLTFTYSKDRSQNSGNDCAYISNLTITPRIIVSTAKALNDSNVYSAGSSYIQNVEYDSQYSLVVPKRDYYSFDGWYNGSEKFENGTWNLTNSVELSARWTPINFGIEYNLNGGQLSSSNPTTYTVESDSITLNNPTRNGYNFIGWTGSNGDTPQLGITISNGSYGDRNYVANWAIETYDIQYNLNGGEVSVANPISYTIETEDVTLINPTKVGCTFVGWTGSNGNEPQINITIPLGSFGNKAYTANWTGNEYSITFNTNGGSLIDTMYISYGSTIKLPDNPKLENKSFVGWFTDSTLKDEFILTTMPAENIQLYAKWIDYDIQLTYDEDKIKSISEFAILSQDIFEAKAVDTDGNNFPLTLSIIGGDLTAGNQVTIQISGTGLYNTPILKILYNVNVYGMPTITYDTSKDFMNATDVLNSELFTANAQDTYGNSLNVNVSIKEENYSAGDRVTVMLAAIDCTNNITTIEIPNVKVYGVPTIYCDVENIKAIENSELNSALLSAYAVDSFGERIDNVEVIVPDGLQIKENIGKEITISLKAVDLHNNISERQIKLKVYGNPIISDAQNKNIKAIYEKITCETLGITVRDSFDDYVENITIELLDEKIAGAEISCKIIATDVVGNVSEKIITGIKIYDKPTISYNVYKNCIAETDEITSELFSAKGFDSFNNELEVLTSLSSGIIQKGNRVNILMEVVDCAGNKQSIIIIDVLVYSNEITLTYSTSANRIKLTSKGEEFNAVAQDCFGNNINTRIVAVSGSLKDGVGKIGGISIKIIAEDNAGNIKESEILENILVYDTPSITFLRNYYYITETSDAYYLLLSVVDSYNTNCTFNAEIINGERKAGNTITVKFYGQDKAKNYFEQEYQLFVISDDAKYILLDVNNGDALEKNYVALSPEAMFTLPIPIREDYVFVGWFDNSNKQYTNENGESIISCDLDNEDVLFAHWKQIYLIDYRYNGGQAENQTTYTETDTLTLNNPTRDGYTFIGWTGSNGDAPEMSVTISQGSSGNKCYTANWEAITYSIKYSLNGGSVDGTNPTNYTIESNTITFINPTKTGNAFIGWTGSNGTESQVEVSIPKGSIGDKEYTANWQIIEYTITYVLIGGSFNEDYPTKYTIESETFTLTNPTKTGYNFVGWTGSNGDAPEMSVNIPQGSSGNKYYTANWEIITYSIGYELNGGSVDGTNPTNYTIESNTITMINPTRIGYTFLGWTGSNGTEPQVEVSIPTGTFGNKNFIANWTIITYTISYNLNNGEVDDKNPTLYTIESENITLINPIKMGYEFIGWTGSNGTEPQIDVSIPTGAIGDKEYTANWEIITYSISYNLNNGKLDGVNPTEYTIESDLTLINPTRIGYTFLGWTENNESTTKMKVTLKNSIGNKSYTANWELINKGIEYELSSDGSYYSLKSDGTCQDSDIILPEEIDGINMASIGRSAFSGCSGLTLITIPESVISIGDYAFDGCSGLISITIPSSVTSIGDYAFSGCSNLTSITIPNSVISIGDYAFYNCFRLTRVNITDLEAWFRISFSDYESNPLYCAHHLYLNNTEITSITVPSSITKINDYALYGASSITSITIPDGVTSIGNYAFRNCSGLTSITLSNKLTSIGSGAFSDCSGLTSITLPDSVTYISSFVFDGCSGLTSITIPDSVTGIGGYTFRDCSGLTTITIPSSVTSISGDVFFGCSRLTSLKVEKRNRKFHSVENCIIDTKDKILIAGCKTSIIPNDGSVIKIGFSAFSGCSGLTSITIPSGVTSIGSGAFSGCSSLTSITIPDSVTSIGKEAFSYCSGLTSITIPSSVTKIGSSAFFGCSGLTSITIPSSVTKIGSSAFFGCSSLTSITIPNSVTSIEDYAFSGCSSLTSITIPNSVTSIGNGAFSYCSGLTSIKIPSSVTSIGMYAFRGCSGLTSITIPSGVTSIGNEAFSGCSSLTIYCEVTSQPTDWSSNWNNSNHPVYWYSETQPTESGNYWHYVDGVVTKW